MTNHWIDIKNSDCILIMGSNAAENHPISFKYVTEAMEKGATLISVDPRFTRTSSKADIYTALALGYGHRFSRGHDQIHPGEQAVQPGVRALYTNAPFIVGKNTDSRTAFFPATRRIPRAPPWVNMTRASGLSRWTRTAYPKWTGR
jgi:formate dehydrogenase major subunit